MSKTSFAALCAVTVVAAGVAVYAASGRQSIEATDRQGERVFPSLVKDVEGLKTVAIRHGGETISLDWDGKTWRVRDRGNYPADNEKVTALIVGLAQATKMEGKTKMPDRYARLEVEDPVAKESKSKQVALIDAGGKEIASLVVGKTQQGLGSQGIGQGGGTYIRLGNDPQAWLVSGSIVADSKAGDWLKKEVIDIKDPAIARVTVTHPNGEKIVASRASGAQTFSIENLPPGKQPASFYVADDYGRLLNAMLMEDVVPAAEKPFPKDKTITAVVDGGPGFQVTLEMAEIEGQNWVRIKGVLPSEKASPDIHQGVDLRTDWSKVIGELNARADGWVFRVPPFQVAALKRKMGDLLKKPEAGSKGGLPPTPE